MSLSSWAPAPGGPVNWRGSRTHAHCLYQELHAGVKGASLGCAVWYGSRETVAASGVAVVSDAALPGTPGIAGLRNYYAEGWNVAVF